MPTFVKKITSRAKECNTSMITRTYAPMPVSCEQDGRDGGGEHPPKPAPVGDRLQAVRSDLARLVILPEWRCKPRRQRGVGWPVRASVRCATGG
ncbi:hypothetical protein GCM10018773_60930 [Streptomyces candidus]|nr:hypothetical protein GCM10018773_60930 [Streptomyces candidus]